MLVKVHINMKKISIIEYAQKSKKSKTCHYKKSSKHIRKQKC